MESGERKGSLVLVVVSSLFSEEQFKNAGQKCKRSIVSCRRVNEWMEFLFSEGFVVGWSTFQAMSDNGDPENQPTTSREEVRLDDVFEKNISRQHGRP